MNTVTIPPAILALHARACKEPVIDGHGKGDTLYVSSTRPAIYCRNDKWWVVATSARSFCLNPIEDVDGQLVLSPTSCGGSAPEGGTMEERAAQYNKGGFGQLFIV